MRLVSLLFSLVIAVAHFGGSAAASQQGKRIGLLTTLNTQAYIGSWTSTFIKLASADGMKVNNITSPFDAALQSQQIDDAIAQKYDLVLVVTINHQAILPALTRAKAAGVPVVLIVAPPGEGYDGLYLSFIGYDMATLGRLAAENLVKGLAEEGKTKAQVAAITGTASQLSTQKRMAGFRAVLAKHPDIKLVAVEDGRWNTAPTEKITGDLLVRFAGSGGLDGIFGMADNMATGVIQAVQSARLKIGVQSKGIVVVSSNCMKDGIANIRNGLQYSTNTQLPIEEAATAVRLIADYFNGKSLKQSEIIPAYSVTKSNVETYEKECSY